MDNKAFITVSGADMDPKQAPVQEVDTRVKMPLLVVGNRTGMWPHVAGTVDYGDNVDVDEEEDVDGEYDEGDDAEDDYSKQRGERDPDLQFAGTSDDDDNVVDDDDNCYDNEQDDDDYDDVT